MWGISTFIVLRGYLKLNTDDKKSVINDFRSRRFIFTICFIVIGGFFTHLGTLMDIGIIKSVGIVLLILGGIFSWKW